MKNIQKEPEKHGAADTERFASKAFAGARYETRQTDFYCRDTRRKPSHLSCPRHLHGQVEMALLLSGQTRVTVDLTPMTASAGDVLLVFPNRMHEYEDLTDVEYVLFIFNSDAVTGLSRRFMTAVPDLPVQKGLGNEPAVRSLFEELSDVYFSEEKEKETVLLGLLTALFGLIFGRIALRQIQSKDIHTLGDILTYVSAHYEDDLSLPCAEHDLGVSRSYISHLFSEWLHVSFCDYVNTVRVEEACRRLLYSSAPVTEIGEAVGFPTLRTFNRVFRKKTGISPTDYRRRSEKDAAESETAENGKKDGEGGNG